MSPQKHCVSILRPHFSSTEHTNTENEAQNNCICIPTLAPSCLTPPKKREQQRPVKTRQPSFLCPGLRHAFQGGWVRPQVTPRFIALLLSSCSFLLVFRSLSGQGAVGQWSLAIPRLGECPGSGKVSRRDPKTRLPTLECCPSAEKGSRTRQATKPVGAFQGSLYTGWALAFFRQAEDSILNPGTEPQNRTAGPAPARPPRGPAMPGECECV